MRRNDLDIDLLFGKDRGQEDTNLSKYFVKTNQYASIYNGNKELVLGRKGSGKSSIFSQLCLELPKDNYVPIPISPTGEDFILLERKISSYTDYVFDDDYKYSLAWYELVLTEIAFSLLTEKNAHFLSGKDVTLYKYLKKNEKVKGDFVSQFASAVLKAFSGGKLNISNIELNVDLSSIREVGIPEEDKIKKVLLEIITENKFFVLVDNLDEPWKNTMQMNCWLRGLILAARRLKRDFKNLKIVIFLRDDIYNEIVKGSDLFDSRSEILILNWRDKHNYSLRQLLSARISNYFGLQYPRSYEECDELLEKIYPLKVVRKSGITYTTKFVADRTFYKPRDFLQFFRNALEISIDDRLPISNGALITAERNFSNWKLSHIEGEYSKTYIGIVSCIDSFAGITTTWRMDYKKLIKHLDSLDEEQKIINITTNKILSSTEMADLLFLIGVLRKVIMGYQNWHFVTYLEEPLPRLKGTLLEIHPAFRTYLAQK